MSTVERTDLLGKFYKDSYRWPKISCNCFYFRQVASRLGITASFVDATNLEKVKAAFKPETKVSMTSLSICIKNVTDLFKKKKKINS